MTKKKVAINGFGRIGRLVFRAYLERSQEFNETYEITYINDLADIDSNIHLLKYDSVHGALSQKIQKTADNKFKVGENEIIVTQERNPVDLNWGEKEVDIVLECTGVFASKEKALSHIESGAKKVIVSAPCTNADITVVQGVNHESMNSDHVVISNASCTTNCLAPLAQIINNTYGIKSGLVNTVHASTNDQSLLDVAHSDLYRARAASASIIPSKTGAAKAIGLVIPELDGKLNGMATRVPTLNVSMLDFTFETHTTFSIDELKQTIQNAANTKYKDILAVCDLPLVSTDFNHNPSSSIFDTNHIYQIGNQTKILAWYDNEWGFSKRMIDLSLYIKEISSISLKETA